MKKVLLVLLSLLMWCNTIGAAAQSGDETTTLTLNQALEMALAGNIDLQQAQNQAARSAIDLRQKKANLLPELSFSANASHKYSQADEAGNGDLNSASFNLQANLNLFNGFADISAIQVSRLELLMSQNDLSRSTQTVLFNTIQAYIQTLTSQEFIRVEAENLEAQRIQLQVIEDFFNAGKRPKADLYQQQAEIAGSELNLLDAKRSDHDKKLALMQVLGESPRADFLVTDPGTEAILERLQRLDTRQLVQDALSKRPDLQGKELGVRASVIDIKAAAAAYWPKVSLSAGIGSSYNDIYSGKFSQQLFDDNLSGSVAVNLSVPIFDRFSTANSVASARIAHKNTQLDWEKAKKQIELDIRQALEAYRSAEQAKLVSESQLTYSRQALDSIEARYKVNAATMAELIQTRAQWVDALYNQVQARFNLVLRAVELAYQCGDDQTMISLIKN